jgi:hypothetical protein
MSFRKATRVTPRKSTLDGDGPKRPSLDHTFASVRKLEQALFRSMGVNLILTVALIVCASGWWLTARDQSATTATAAVSDCRSYELAVTLEQFRVLVTQSSSDAAQKDAERKLAALGPLEVRYEHCLEDPTYRSIP